MSLHGIFNQTPNNHIYISNGCPSCGYNTSKPANKWLDVLGISKEYREKHIKINGINFKVDAYDPTNYTIYEYFGYFWHGHPDYHSHNKINPKNKVSFKILYDKTLERIDIFEKSEYQFIYLWGK